MIAASLAPHGERTVPDAFPATPRIALLADMREEGWPSMDLVAEMTAAELERAEVPMSAELLRPAMRRRFSGAGASEGKGFTTDRVLNRFVDYPRFLRAQRGRFDLFHVLDHSYAHLALEVPAGRVVMHCHDIEAFRSVLEPQHERRSAAFRLMTRRLIAGFRSAARVLCISSATREAVIAHGLMPADRVEVAYLGVHPSCTPAPHEHADHAAVGLLGPHRHEAPELLHVGSSAPRKRIDVLLRAFAALRATWPEARLVRVGGPMTDSQQALADRLGVAHHVVTLPYVTREVLAAVYRRAALVLQPSDAEGFGLPVAEAMACGTPVLASDIGVLREIGGGAAAYAAAGDSAAFAAEAVELLAERDAHPAAWARRRERGLAQAARFTWRAHADRVLGAYERTLAELAHEGGARS